MVSEPNWTSCQFTKNLTPKYDSFATWILYLSVLCAIQLHGKREMMALV